MGSANKVPIWNTGYGRDHVARRLLWQRGHCFAPNPILIFDIGQDEVVLGRKVTIEGRLGHASLRGDAVDADRMDALRVKQPGSGPKQALASGAGGKAAIGNPCIHRFEHLSSTQGVQVATLDELAVDRPVTSGFGG